MRIAVIGAGMAGLTVAEHLQSQYQIQVFEKSRGFGGRMATRRADAHQFDHGAQHFTARTPEFRSFLAPYIERGSVRLWSPELQILTPGAQPEQAPWREPHYVAAPKMTALAEEMAQGLDIHRNTHIASMIKQGEEWLLQDTTGEIHGPFEWVIVCTPAEQARALLPATFNEFDALTTVKQQSCFALMLGFSAPLAIDFQAAKVKQSPISWICLDSSKPSRGGDYSILVQSSNEWAAHHLDRDPQVVAELLLAELSAVLHVELAPTHLAVHRWLYASTTTTTVEDYLIDRQNALAVCGDWCVKGRVEGAFLSASRLAKTMLASARPETDKHGPG